MEKIIIPKHLESQVNPHLKKLLDDASYISQDGLTIETEYEEYTVRIVLVEEEMTGDYRVIAISKTPNDGYFLCDNCGEYRLDEDECLNDAITSGGHDTICNFCVEEDGYGS